MCGIAGLIHRDGRLADLRTIQAMTDAVSHRGPDGRGVLLEGPVAFGHRRLSIIDLTDHGHQPMDYGPSGLSLTFNGEIYNYLELRGELVKKGYSFASNSDSEVILAAYACWGVDCVTHFNGMWAFAILDRTRNIVFISRDRFGVKPLYYLSKSDLFAFGSEIRQLLPLCSSIGSNKQALLTFLISDAADVDNHTFFTGIERLPGGHNAIYDIRTHSFLISRYYSLARSPSLLAMTPEDAITRFSELFSDSVNLRLRSDVTVGTCLSGGLDSSSVACIASEQYRSKAGRQFSAITAISEEQRSDESEFAKLVVQAADLSWLPIRPSYSDFVDHLPAVVAAQEEPFTSTSTVMQYFVMQEARRNDIKVLLDGQGGDEILLGYEKYYGSYILSSFLNGGLVGGLRATSAVRRSNSKMNVANMIKYVIGGASSSARFAAYKRQNPYVKRSGTAPPHLKLFSKALLNTFDLQRLELESTNLPLLLRYEDKNSMACSIETRLPFLDYRLVEFSLSLMESLKIRDGWTKWVLRKSMDRHLPPAVTWRRNKFGFEAPDEIWQSAHVAEMQRAVCSSPLLAEIADTKWLEASYTRLGRRSRWRLYSVALWERAFAVVS